jgi:hypothetical protein
MPANDKLDDVLWGIRGPGGIAAFLRKKPYEVEYLIRKGRLPVRKHSHKIVTASKAQLREYFGPVKQSA